MRHISGPMLLANICVSLLLWHPSAFGIPSQETPAPSTTPATSPSIDTKATEEPAPQQSMATAAPTTKGASKVTPKPATSGAKSVARKSKRKRPVPVEGIQKTVIRNGGTSEPKVQLSPGVSQQQAVQEKQSTNQLLAIANGNLQKVSSRQLDASQQETVRQIRNYMEQSKQAEKEGDPQRAQNLASKARQLSDDLLRR